MFVLRFCADFIEKKIGLSPVGILLTCAILACLGLNLTSYITTFGGAMIFFVSVGALTTTGVGAGREATSWGGFITKSSEIWVTSMSGTICGGFVGTKART